MKPSVRLELIAQRLTSIALTSAKVAPRSLYVGFRALVQMNSESALASTTNGARRGQQQQQQRHRGEERREGARAFPAFLLEELSTSLVQSARTVPARNIAPCLFAVSHGLQPPARIRALDWDVLQQRVAADMRAASAAAAAAASASSPPAGLMNADDTVSLLHSLSLHGRISSPLLRDQLFERLASVLPDVTRGQLLSIIYSVAALGLGVAESGVADATAGPAATDQQQVFVDALHRLLSETATTFALGETARMLAKVSTAVALSPRRKKDLCAPFLPHMAQLLREVLARSQRGGQQQQNHGSGIFSECPVLLLALARLRLFRDGAFVAALECAMTPQAQRDLNRRQRVLVLFALHTAGIADVLAALAAAPSAESLAARLESWFVETAAGIVASDDEIDAEMQSRRWDNVTLSYFSVSLSSAIKLLEERRKNNELQQADQLLLERISKLHESVSARLASSSTRKGSAAAPAVSSSSSLAPTEGRERGAFPQGGTASVSIVTAAMHDRQNATSAKAVAAVDERLSAALEQPLSSHERLTAFNTFAQRVAFSENNAQDAGAIRRLVDKQLQLIVQHVRFSAVPTSTIVAYLRVLGRLRLSGGGVASAAPYEGALSVLLGEMVTGQSPQQQQQQQPGERSTARGSAPSSFAAFVARQQPPRHVADFPEQEESVAGQPRSLLPSEAATILVVMARAGFRRYPHQVLRLCHILARRADDVSQSLRLAALYSVGSELRCPDRHFTEAMVRSVLNGGGASQVGFTRSDAAHALIGCAFSCNVDATRSLSRAAIAYLEAATSGAQREVLSRSRQLQIPVAMALVGAYPDAAPSSAASSAFERLVSDAVGALDRANLPESWYTLLFWRHSVSPLLAPGARAKSEDGLRRFVQARLEPVMAQAADKKNRGGLSVFYQLACGLELLWPVRDAGVAAAGSPLRESSAKLLWLPLVPRLRGGCAVLPFYPELVLPAGLCLARILRAAASAASSSSSSGGQAEDENTGQAALRSLALEMHAALEKSVRLVTRADDLALLLHAFRRLALDAAEAIATSEEQGESGAAASGSGSETRWVEDVCCAEILVPLMRTVATTLYLRETAPPAVSSQSGVLSVHSGLASLVAPPTAQLSCVGLRLVCEALADGVLFDGEAETFEICANVVGLATQRLEPSLSAWDAAGSLRSLMAMATAPVVTHTPATFSAMDTLATVARSRAPLPQLLLEHHRALLQQVLPGIGAAGISGSLLSL